MQQVCPVVQADPPATHDVDAAAAVVAACVAAAAVVAGAAVVVQVEAATAEQV